MKKFLAIFLLFVPGIIAGFSQVVVSDPALPFDSQPVTIIFDANQGSGGLKDYTGDVYAHTGVLLETSGGTWDWKYVKTSWGQNTPDTKLTRVTGEDDLYELFITPSIRDYYGVPDGDRITHMAFVFRSAQPYSGSTYYEGKDSDNSDIFVQVFEEGLSLSISEPGRYTIKDPNQDINFNASVTLSSDLSLYLNGSIVKSVTGTSINHTFNFTDPGDYIVKCTADDGNDLKSDSSLIHITGVQIEEPVPAGLQEGVRFPDNQTAEFMIYAPLKESVFLIGDFNGWLPYSEYRLKKDGDYFWLRLENLEPGIEYSYQYLIDRNLLIADPYSRKILDPSNDRWIDDNIYQGLLRYPYSLTEEIVSVFRTDREEYTWSSEFTAPAKDKLVIYELLLRDFIEAHDWATLTDTLDYLDALGVNAIELMPVNEFEGNESWGYNPSFYFAPDKYYGPEKDMKVFIDSCHQRGIAVILDMVFNHSFGQSPMVRMYMTAKGYPSDENPWFNADFVLDDPNGWYQARHPYSVGYDFNHSSPQTQKFIDSVNRFWLEEFKVDGFRFDLSKGFTQKSTYLGLDDEGNAIYDENTVSQYDPERIQYLKRMAGEIWKTNENAYVILEHFCANNEEKELAAYGMMLWGNMNYNYSEASMGYLANSDLAWISYKQRGWTDPNLVGYMESHDEERLMYRNLTYGNSEGEYDITEFKTALGRAELAAVFFFPVPGPKMLWQFGEMGYDFSIDYNGRLGNKPIRWDYYFSRIRLRQVYTELIKLKTTEPAFSTSDFNLVTSGSIKRIELNHEDMDVRIIGNFDLVEGTGRANFSRTGNWYEYFSGEILNVEDIGMDISLAPGEYRIYTTKQFEVPDISNGIDQFQLVDSGISIYPNPVGDILYISGGNEITRIDILDVNGRLILSNSQTQYQDGIEVSSLVSGVYFLLITTKESKTDALYFIRK